MSAQSPTTWRKATLNELATLQRGFDLPIKKRLDGDIPIFAANGPVGYHNTAKVKGPGVVTGRSGTIGKVHYVESNYWPLNTSLFVKDFHGNDPKYVSWFLKWLHLERYHEGTGVPTLNRNNIHGLNVFIPPLSEQKRIAAILDKADAIRRKRKQALELADNFLRATFLDMFGDPVTNPMGWEVKELGEISSEVKYGTSEKCNSEYTSESFPVLRIPNIINGTIQWDDLKYLTPSPNDKKKLSLREKDLLIVRTNGNPDYIGRCSVFKGQTESLFASYLIRI